MAEKLVQLKKKGGSSNTTSEYYLAHPTLGAPEVIHLPQAPVYVSICVSEAGCVITSYTLGNTGLTLISGYGNTGLFGTIGMSADGKTMTVNQAWGANHAYHIVVSY